MNQVRVFAIGAMILAVSLLPGLTHGSAAVASECAGIVASPPVSVTIPDVGQSGPGDTASPTPTACATTAPPATVGSTPGSIGGSVGSSSGGEAASPTTAAGLSGEVVAPSPPSTPSANASKLALDPERIAVHKWMTATGNGYTAGENVQFALYPGVEIIGSYAADASGKVMARFRIPDETRSGTHVLEATGWASKKVSNGEFTVVTEAGAGTIPTLWWVIILCIALLIGLAVMAIYFRRSIARAFRSGPDMVGSTP